MNCICVVQVTCESEDFFAKSLASIGEKSALEFLLDRLKTKKFWKKVIVATTVSPLDDIIVKIAEKLEVEVFRGDRKDVISRIFHAVESYRPEVVVKVFGNSPLIDLDEIDKMVQIQIQDGYDCSYNEHPDGVIHGVGCSAFSLSILERLVYNTALTPRQREVGTLYIRQHPEEFKIYRHNAEFSWPQYNVSIIQPKDLELIKTIIKYVQPITNNAIGVFLDENPLLTAYQHEDIASEAGIEKLFLFPEKIKQYQKDILDPAYPVSVELSLTNNCNFNCTWCSDAALRKRLGGEFDFKKYIKLIDELQKGGTRGIVVEGGGEPTLHPRFDDIVKAAFERNLSVGLITNGSMRIKKDIIPCCDWIRISLDAATPAQHRECKGTNIFDKILENIRHIAENKKNCTLGVGYVVTKNNIENLEDLILVLRQYRVDYVQFRPVVDNPDQSIKIDLSHLRKFSTPEFRVDIQAMNMNKFRGNAGKPCLAHSLSTVVTADGGVYLCGRLNVYDWCKPIGNINEMSFDEIWHSEERKKQALQVRDPEFCKLYCIQCRMTKYNLLLDRINNIKTRNFI